MKHVLFVATLLMLVCVNRLSPGADGLQDFVRRSGDRLYDGPSEFRFVSWNIPNLHLVEDEFKFLGESPWRWPDEFEIRDALESVRQMGGTVVRPYVISVRRDESDMGRHVHVVGPGEFNEEAFETLDLVLKIAAEKRVRVIIPLVDNWRWWGGIEQYAAFRGKKADQFWVDRQLIEDFKKTVHFVVNRRNTLTGKLYRDEPAIFAWETGNELDAPPEWTAEIASYLKQLDSNHLVIDGRSLHGVPIQSLDDPNIDIVTTHHYPNSGNNNAGSIKKYISLIEGKKAYFVGEFGFVAVDEAQRMLDAVHELGVSGALYWSLRFHRREGGFYWHHEPSGGDLFKAYHWPGFPSGIEYREDRVIPMIRQAAFRIRGMEVKKTPAPSAPTLLGITDVARISWQGSTGASTYNVERSFQQSGPWELVGENVSDAAVQYRPLFADASARPDQEYFYRVIAKAVSDVSNPSNVVGPVAVEAYTLVDEMRNLELVAASAKPLELRTGNARKVQEDAHRVALLPGGSLTYHLPGSVERVKVWAFSQSDEAVFDLSSSTAIDGEFAKLDANRQTKQRTAGDYDYLYPTLFQVDAVQPDARFVRLAVPAGTNESETQISRLEIRYGDAEE